MTGRTPYDKHPYIPVDSDSRRCSTGWQEIGARLRHAAGESGVVCIECYPGVIVSHIEEFVRRDLNPSILILTDQALRPQNEIENIVQPFLTDDPVFGLMNDLRLQDLFDPRGFEQLRSELRQASSGVRIVLGTGASLFAPDPGLLVYADLARWEIQQRQRQNIIGNFAADNLGERSSLKYKRAFFIDWRVADHVKRDLIGKIDFLLDTNIPQKPQMISGADLRRGLCLAVSRPFRVVPFFDPGPWGGHWMQERFDLPAGPPNYAWGFDCVPEENSLLLGFGEKRVEIPSIDVVFWHPKELLGESVYQRFGAEFPIRFDLLDTMGGGNLSLQVHPLTSYIRQHFGMHYTQDESYYMLDAAPDACVYLGLKDGIDRQRMIADLQAAQEGSKTFPANDYVNRWSARKHDHFLIPGGTIHCSGRNGVVLEISATPYIFTFKLWDWGRLDLDGHPRPIHLEHGLANIQWDRTAGWVRDNLINVTQPRSQGTGWREERTGLHSLEFIETRRHWFTEATPHDTEGSVNVVNLVAGDQAMVESPEGAFEPFVVNYAETFIVPAAVGRYTIRPHGTRDGSCEYATMRASVRDSHAE